MAWTRPSRLEVTCREMQTELYALDHFLDVKSFMKWNDASWNVILLRMQKPGFEHYGVWCSVDYLFLDPMVMA